MRYRSTCLFAAAILCASAPLQAGQWQHDHQEADTWHDASCQSQQASRHHNDDWGLMDCTTPSQPQSHSYYGWPSEVFTDTSILWCDPIDSNHPDRPDRYTVPDDCDFGRDWIGWCDDDHHNHRIGRHNDKHHDGGYCPPHEDPIPEPATAGLSLMGLAALTAALKRRRH